MAQDHTAYPHLARLVNEMSHANGGTAARTAQGLDADADRMRALDELLGAEGVYHDDLAALDVWLGALPEDKFLTVVDGEETEVAAIFADAPGMGDEVSGQQYIDHLYEETV